MRILPATPSAAESCRWVCIQGLDPAGGWEELEWRDRDAPLPGFSSFLSPCQAFDDFIFAFFAVEMVVKMVALGIFGKKCYLGDTWNRLDFFIVIAG